jgi:Asp-tRNA(Asn)/Glu-tRNA(Gln) amidotransferase A subunit family amidase
MTSITHTPAWKLAARMAKKEISPLEVMRETLDRIDRINPGLNAFVSLRPEAALGEARTMTEKMAAGKPIGPWPGCPWVSRTWRILPAW